MSLVKWVHQDHLSDEQYPLDVAFEGVVPVIPLSALTEVVEGLRFYADPQSYGMSGGTVDRIIQDAGKRAQHLLAQLTEKQP